MQGDEVFLTLQGTGYLIQRAGASGRGSTSVNGDRIEFFGSSLCEGTGVYTWAIEDGRLRLTELESDPCTGRTDVFLRGTFGRVDP